MGSPNPRPAVPALIRLLGDANWWLPVGARERGRLSTGPSRSAFAYDLWIVMLPPCSFWPET